MADEGTKQKTVPTWLRWACAMLAVVVGVIVVAFGLTFGRLFHSAGAFRTKAEVVGLVREIGAAQVTSEARALLSSLEPDVQLEGNSIPPALARLKPIYVATSSKAVHVKIAGLGDWAGLVVVPKGETWDGEKVAEGIYWVDPTQRDSTPN